METTGNGAGKSRAACGLVFLLILSNSISVLISASLDQTEEKTGADWNQESKLELTGETGCAEIMEDSYIYREPNKQTWIGEYYVPGWHVLIRQTLEKDGVKWYHTNEGWILANTAAMTSIGECRS